MIIGVPKEIKDNEYRVAVTPDGVDEIISHGHKVFVESEAGEGSGYEDKDYKKVGAEIVDNSTLFEKSKLIYKVKEFLPEEYKYLKDDMIVLTYIHSNAFPKQTDAFLENNVTGIAYEDIEVNGEFPLLKPMSKIAGMGGFIKGTQYLQKINGGSGVLPVRLEGVEVPEVIIIGAGNSGLAAAELAANYGNKVTIFEIDTKKMEKAKNVLPNNVELLYSKKSKLRKKLKKCDLLINCVLWPKWKKEPLITKKMINNMKDRSVIIDVACDEIGAVETCKTTSHSDPIFFEEGVLHYCVDNIPSLFATTASKALSEVTLPYLLKIADDGLENALKSSKPLRKGLSFYQGKLTIKETALKQNRTYVPSEIALGMKEE